MILYNIFTILGLLLSIIGAIKLIEPFILGNKAILELSSYEDSGVVLGMGIVKKYNQEAINNFKNSRDKTFEGISLIFLGFQLQLIPQVFLFIEKIFLFDITWIYVILFLPLISFLDWFILNKMLKRKEELSLEVEVI